MGKDLIIVEFYKKTSVSFAKEIEAIFKCASAYLSFVTIPVNVLSAHRSLSQSKLIKTYLSNCMGQKRLRKFFYPSNIPIVQMSFDDINTFAEQKAQKNAFV